MSERKAVAYGWHSVGTLLRVAPQRIRTLLLSKERLDRRAKTLAERAEAAGISVLWTPSETLAQQVGHPRHQGVVALLDEAQAEVTLEAVLPESADYPNPAGRRPLSPPLYLVLDGVTDPHNLGACLRTADALGVRAVIVPKDRSAGVTPVVRKVASGALDAVPLVFVTNLARALDTLKAQGVWVVGLAGEAAQPLGACPLDGAVALVLGAEGEGLRRLTRERCDVLAHLPMFGIVESLNVSVATGIALYEVVRRRTNQL